MSHYTKQDILQMVDEEDVEFIRLQFTDLFGTLKNVAITKTQLERALNNQYVFDGSFSRGDRSRARWRVLSVMCTARMRSPTRETRAAC